MTATTAVRGPGATTTTPLFAAAAFSALAGWTVHAAYARRALTAARRDPVTGLAGRDGWTAQARRIMRGGGTRTVILVDLDRFKHVNDTYGQPAATSSRPLPEGQSPRRKPRTSPHCSPGPRFCPAPASLSP
ncbi:MAG TPA: diguanylate cyclase [Trebonia sp.]|nr:diguanylate cyclase [Trebonia sp.]